MNRRAWLALAAAVGLVACVHEDGVPATVAICDPAVADCTLCSLPSDCHNGTALGFSENGWRCDNGKCAAAECQDDNDCDCGKRKFANGWCKAGLCFCTQCTKASHCKSGQTCDDNRCSCAVASECSYGCRYSGVCAADAHCWCNAN